MLNKEELAEIEQKIEYTFENKSFLIRAFTHSSYSNEHVNCRDYERLEFLGDAAVEYFVSLNLLKTFPNAKEGVLSQKRASLVNAHTLAKIIVKLDLIKYLQVGACDIKSNVRDSQKVKCDVFEAIVGAILLDSKSTEKAEKFVLYNLEPYISKDIVDYKSKLLEYCAKTNRKAVFEIAKKDEYEPYFQVNLVIDDNVLAKGEGRNKKSAEKDASKNYLNSL